MIRYNVKVNEQIYQVDLEKDVATPQDAESTESSADICFDAIKAEYDYCVTRAEKLENKVYILLAACAFVFTLLTTQIEKVGKMKLPQSGYELVGIIIYVILPQLCLFRLATPLLILILHLIFQNSHSSIN